MNSILSKLFSNGNNGLSPDFIKIPKKSGKYDLINKNQIDAIVEGLNESYVFETDGSRKVMPKGSYVILSRELGEDFINATYSKICWSGLIVEYKAKIRKRFITGEIDGRLIIDMNHVLDRDEMFKID